MGCKKNRTNIYIYFTHLNIQKKSTRPLAFEMRLIFYGWGHDHIQRLSQKPSHEPPSWIPRNPECSGVDVMLFDLLLWLSTVSQIRLTLLFSPCWPQLDRKSLPMYSVCIYIYIYVCISAAACMLVYMWTCMECIYMHTYECKLYCWILDKCFCKSCKSCLL